MPDRRPFPWPMVLLRVLAAHDEGVRAVDCWQALGEPRPPYQTVHYHLQRPCQHGIVVRVAWGRYALTRACRARGGERHPPAAPEPR